jgi:hypothetical protein
MQEEFYRIKRLPPYVFAEVNALKAWGKRLIGRVSQPGRSRLSRRGRRLRSG